MLSRLCLVWIFLFGSVCICIHHDMLSPSHLNHSRLVERIRTDKNVSEFFIDASHELSLFAWNRGKGHKLTEAPYFCAERKSSDKGNGCAIYSRISDVGAGSYADGRVCGDDTPVCPSTTATRPTTKSESFVSSALENLLLTRAVFLSIVFVCAYGGWWMADGGGLATTLAIHTYFISICVVRANFCCFRLRYDRTQKRRKYKIGSHTHLPFVVFIYFLIYSCNEHINYETYVPTCVHFGRFSLYCECSVVGSRF